VPLRVLEINSAVNGKLHRVTGKAINCLVSLLIITKHKRYLDVIYIYIYLIII